MPVKTKRWNDPRDEGDGFRLLICRYRPRGVSKAKETWDAWWPQLGPSPALHAAYWGKGQAPIDFASYGARYLEEMNAERERIGWLATRVAAGETITLLCTSACTDPAQCHRTLLARLLTGRPSGARRRSGRAS